MALYVQPARFESRHERQAAWIYEKQTMWADPMNTLGLSKDEILNNIIL